jgi:Vac7-like protein
MRTPAMTSSSMLETVQEVSQPNSPGQLDSALTQVNEKLTGDTGFNPLYPILADNKILTLKSPTEGETIIRSETRRSTTTVPPTITRQSSALSAKQGKTKAAGEGSTQAMIVETETVSSVPQVALAPGSKAESVNGTLKAKPSTETIRPKKEKKKNSRKQPAVAQGTGEPQSFTTSTVPYQLRHHQSMRSVSSMTDGGVSPVKMHSQGLCPDEPSFRLSSTPCSRTSSINFSVSSLLTRPRPASSKADIFEAKVASAVDEADTSDSEETFVYDSNPPDGGDRPRRFHHSRTPSATSMVSQADRTAMRSIHSVMENTGGPPVTMKKGMKFVNSFAAGNVSDSLTTGDDDGKGSGRSVGPGSTRGTVRHHHNHLTHIGRWGRNGSNTHPSLFDNESPFPQAARPKFSGTASRQSSQPPSPRFPNSRGVSQSIKKSSMQGHSYDLDETTGADDERTPLITPSMRSNRSRGRRNPANLRHLEAQTYRQRPSYLNRFAACLVVTMMLLLVITGAIGFMFATSQPLTDIELVSITNVIASDPELMFDMTVRAHNPNIVVVSIDQANIEVFAKSIHAGTDGDWWKQPDGPDGFHISDDPPPDDDPAPNMRLGAITEFDSPLSFEGSFFNKGVSTSTGEMRLALPGNHTAGGSERWSRIIQDEFDLVLKGVVRYSLPLSQRVRSAPISGRATVKPNAANDPSFNSTLPSDGSDIS